MTWTDDDCCPEPITGSPRTAPAPFRIWSDVESSGSPEVRTPPDKAAERRRASRKQVTRRDQRVCGCFGDDVDEP